MTMSTATNDIQQAETVTVMLPMSYGSTASGTAVVPTDINGKLVVFDGARSFGSNEAGLEAIAAAAKRRGARAIEFKNVTQLVASMALKAGKVSGIITIVPAG
jgi:hypothetical protein